MTNTLHRFGPAESFFDDFVVFAIASRGRNEEGALEKLRTFLRMAVPFGPVNLGDARNGGAAASLPEHDSAGALEARHALRISRP